MKWWNLIVSFGLNEFLPDKDLVQAWRDVSECVGCPSLKMFSENDVYKQLPAGSRMIWHAPPRSGWCGNPGDKVAGESCGCFVLAETEFSTLTVDGIPVEPAGKGLKDETKCPRRRWTRDRLAKAKGVMYGNISGGI